VCGGKAKSKDAKNPEGATKKDEKVKNDKT